MRLEYIDQKKKAEYTVNKVPLKVWSFVVHYTVRCTRKVLAPFYVCVFSSMSKEAK